MAAIVDFLGVQATIHNYIWKSDDKHLAEDLNLMLDEYGPSGADPDPDYTAAEQAIDAFGYGKIIYAPPVPGPYEQDGETVY